MTGATGHMGIEALKLLVENENIYIKILVLGNRRDKKILRSLKMKGNLEIVKGDLRSIHDIRKGLRGADFVLHIGALIPPAADYHPDTAEEINFGGTRNILQVIKEQKNRDVIRFVYIATVASMGNRPVPIHWGRVGDPIRLSHFDGYGASKVKAERAVIESNLNYWVSLRQSGMLHRDLAKAMEPIIYHQPINNHVEWSTAEDSGRALYNICTMDLPDGFWKNIYNIGSGPDFRMTNFEFMQSMFNRLGVGDFRRFLKPGDFAMKNFHCVWYADSHLLEQWLHFRKGSFKDFLDSLNIPVYYKLARFIPARWMRKFIFEPLARHKEGTLHWIENNVVDKIKAFWGSRDIWESLPESWDRFELIKNPSEKILIHGYDDRKADGEVGLEDCRQAATFRGGECLSLNLDRRVIDKCLKWRCSCGKIFDATARLVLKGGHWCPDCDLDVDNYGRLADKSRFFAQVYEP